MYYIIYETELQYNNKKLYYRGKHITKNIYDNYFGSGIILNRIIRKCIKNNIEYSINKIILDDTASNKDELDELEKIYVNKEWLEKDSTINIALGGYGGVFYGKKRIKHSNNMKGSKNPFYGKTHSDETKKILSKKAKSNIKSKNPFYGKTHSDETKKLISKKIKLFYLTNEQVNKGRIFQEEHKENIAKQKIGQTLTYTTKEKISNQLKNSYKNNPQKKRNAAWNYYNELYKLWLDNNCLKKVLFTKLAIQNNYPNVNYSRIVEKFFKDRDQI